MGMIATAVRCMMAAGMSSDAIIAAIDAMESSVDARSAGAKRQARYRERSKAAVKTGSIAPDARDVGDACLADAPGNALAERVVTAWNEAAAGRGLSRARPLDPDRKAWLRARANAHGEQAVFEAIANLAASRFHCGENERGWKATLGWLLETPRNFHQALELGGGADVPGSLRMSAAERSAYLAGLDARPWMAPAGAAR